MSASAAITHGAYKQRNNVHPTPKFQLLGRLVFFRSHSIANVPCIILACPSPSSATAIHKSMDKSSTFSTHSASSLARPAFAVLRKFSPRDNDCLSKNKFLIVRPRFPFISLELFSSLYLLLHSLSDIGCQSSRVQGKGRLKNSGHLPFEGVWPFT